MKLATAHIGPNEDPKGVDIILSSNFFNKSRDPGLLMAPEAIGRLKRELTWTVGETRTLGIFARLGFSCGQTDALDPHFKNQLIQSVATLQNAELDETNNEFIIETTDSCEASEYLRFFPSKARACQCWLLAGYLTGSFSGHLNEPITFLETHCIAKGDSSCRFIGRRLEDWTADDAVSFTEYDEDNMALELADVYEQLKLTKDRYQNLFEQASVPIFIVDPETGRYLDVNIAGEELTGYTREQLSGMNIFDISQASDHQRVVDSMKKLLSEGNMEDREIAMVRRDGMGRMTAQSFKLMSFGGQGVIQVVVRDITDLKMSEQKEKMLQEQLLRSERLSSIGRLAAGVAHELKNPLGAIKNAIYYVRDILKGSEILESDPHLKEILKLVEGEVDSSVMIIGELLDFSRVVHLVPRKTMINELLEQIPSLILFPDTIEFKLDLDLRLPHAMVDPDRLNQVFCNITNNAIQAMAQGGTLTVSSRFEIASKNEEGPKSEFIAISFQDTGVGIEPIHLSKIFEPLFTTKARGTGLGLAISNNIIEKHGGSIAVTSQRGKGSCFTVNLPLKPPEEKEENHHEPQ